MRTNIDPYRLPIPAALAGDLAAWAVSYDQTLDLDHPPDSRFPDPETEDAFWAAGVLLACRLAIELVGHFTVTVYDDRLRERLVLPASTRTRIHGGWILLSEHRWDLSDEPSQRQTLTKQLQRELPVGHILGGRDVELIVRCMRRDDVLVHLGDDGEYGIVHLTWRKGPEISPAWPSAGGRQRGPRRTVKSSIPATATRQLLIARWVQLSSRPIPWAPVDLFPTGEEVRPSDHPWS